VKEALRHREMFLVEQKQHLSAVVRGSQVSFDFGRDRGISL
jgi:hypothetical protein